MDGMKSGFIEIKEKIGSEKWLSQFFKRDKVLEEFL